MIWIILLGAIIVVAIAATQANKNNESLKSALSKHGFKYEDFVDGGAYAGGHPDIDLGYTRVKFIAKDRDLQLWAFGDKGIEFVSSIPIESIKNITVEDRPVLNQR